MTASEFQKVAPTIPGHPGIYKYFDASGDLLYVGKAKNLRKRVGSYFLKTTTSYKTHELVQRISHIEFTIVDSEQDAFLLENSLIKQFQPKYNINLKDDKTYPFIVIKKEPFPRIFLTRRKINDGSEYLGPFTSAGKVRELIAFIRQYIPLRTCKLLLSEEQIRKKKFRVCLEYHLGNCKGPCEGLQDEADYAEGLRQIRQILKGNLAPVILQFKKEMQIEALNMHFEKAEIIRKKIDHLEHYQAHSVIVSKHLTNVDVFSVSKDGDTAFVNYLMVQNGTIVQTHTIPLDVKIDEPEADILVLAILHIRETFNSLARELVVPFPIVFPGNDILITVPKAGDKKKLLELSEKNVNYFKEELKKKNMLRLESSSRQEPQAVLHELQNALHLPRLPQHIECFDNSNFQGSFPVSAMVCFKNGVASKKDYRHFNVKTVKGIDDFATMEEVVYRRYARLLRENQELPQLIIIDGGKGQLHAAMKSITNLGLGDKITVMGLAKNAEELFFPGDTESIKLDWKSDGLRLIRRIRDEVHRFGISFHRDQRSRGTFVNELEQITGIGEQTASEMLKRFKSISKIKTKTIDELAEVAGKSKARLIWNYFHGS